MGGDICAGWLYLTPDMMNSVIWPCAHVCQRASTKPSQAAKASNPVTTGRSSRARIEPSADRRGASVPVVEVSCTVFIRPVGKTGRPEVGGREKECPRSLPESCLGLPCDGLPCDNAQPRSGSRTAGGRRRGRGRTAWSRAPVGTSVALGGRRRVLAGDRRGV